MSILSALPADPALGPRRQLARRLVDIVAMPETRINRHERSIAADLLLDLLRGCEVEVRVLAARRLSGLQDVPRALVRFLVADVFDVAQPLLETCVGLEGADLAFAAQEGETAHRLAIAGRRDLDGSVTDALTVFEEPDVARVLIKNATAYLSEPAVDRLVGLCDDAPDMIDAVLRRPELRPSSAMRLFWAASHEARLLLLQRYAVERSVLLEMAADLYAAAGPAARQDEVCKRSLAVIDRRQRNRRAPAESLYTSLEAAIDGFIEKPLADGVAEIAHFAGVHRQTALRAFRDVGGDGLAVLCKACGIRRPRFLALAEANFRLQGDSEAQRAAKLVQVERTFDSVAVAKAQTALRYWNWLNTDPALAVAMPSLAQMKQPA